MIRTVLALFALLASAPPATAQQSATLQAIVGRGAIRLGVADDAPPFSWVGLDGAPIGYAVDLCRRVAADAAGALGWRLLDPGEPAQPHAVPLEYVPLPVAAQSASLADGTVDLACSAAAFAPNPALAASPPLAVSGTRLLAARLGPISSFSDLAGRTVAVVPGTESASALLRLGATLSPPLRIANVPSPGDGYELLATGGADAFAADDLLLAGLLATRTDGPSFEVVGRELSHGPLAISFRSGDPAFAAIVQRSLAHMAADGTLRARYARWFTTPVPEGASLKRPMSRELADIDRALADQNAWPIPIYISNASSPRRR